METTAVIQPHIPAAPVAPSRCGCLRKHGPRAVLVGTALWQIVQIVGSLPWLVTKTVEVHSNGIHPPTESLVHQVNWTLMINNFVSTLLLIPILARLRKSTIQLEADQELRTTDVAARKQLGLGLWHSVRLSAPIRRCVRLTDQERRYLHFVKHLTEYYWETTINLAKRQDIATHEAALRQFRTQAAQLRARLVQ